MKRTSTALTARIICCMCAGIISSHAAWTSGTYGLINYKLFVPDTTKSTGKFPLVLYLHPNGWQGDIDNEVNNIDQDILPSVLAVPDTQSRHPCFVFAPECPRSVGGPSIAAWLAYSTNWQLGWDPNVYTIDMRDSNYYTLQLKHVVRALDSMCTRVKRIDTNRIHLAGGSMGANATMYLISRYPGRFASATAVAFNGDTARAKYTINTPMWLFWGDGDPTVAWQGAVLLKDAIVNAGGKPNWKQFPNVGHLWSQVWDKNEKDFFQPGLVAWMLSQSKATTPAFTDAPAAVVRNRTRSNPPEVFSLNGRRLSPTARAAVGYRPDVGFTGLVVCRGAATGRMTILLEP